MQLTAFGLDVAYKLGGFNGGERSTLFLKLRYPLPLGQMPVFQ